MPNNEYTLKNENYKKTEITLSNITIVKEALQEFAYSHFKGSCFSINFFGKIDKDFRVIAIIGEADNDNIIFKANPEELDKKFRFGVFNIKKIFLEQGLVILLNLIKMIFWIKFYAIYLMSDLKVGILPKVNLWA